MSTDSLHYAPWVTQPRDQAPIEAPRVAAAADAPTSWALANRNGALPMRTAGAAPTKRLPADAPVTVPPGLVITVCPSTDELAAARRAATAQPMVGQPLGLHADWLAARAKRPGRRKKKQAGGAA